MKKRELSKKLQLNKSTITNMINEEQQMIMGGAVKTVNICPFSYVSDCPFVVCKRTLCMAEDTICIA